MDETSGRQQVHPPYQAFYIQSMLFNAASAVRSVQQVNAMLAAAMEGSPEDPYEALYGTRFLAELQSLVVHAAALSRYFWPVGKDHRWRGSELREVFGIADDNPLRSRELRNAIEHFDERLDRYLADGIVGYILPEYIGPTIKKDGVPAHIFRAYYVETARFQLLGDTHEIQPIASEVGKIYSRLVKMDKDGGTFGRGRA